MSEQVQLLITFVLIAFCQIGDILAQSVNIWRDESLKAFQVVASVVCHVF